MTGEIRAAPTLDNPGDRGQPRLEDVWPCPGEQNVGETGDH